MKYEICQMMFSFMSTAANNCRRLITQGKKKEKEWPTVEQIVFSDCFAGLDAPYLWMHLELDEVGKDTMMFGWHGG